MDVTNAIAEVTNAIKDRSEDSRQAYLEQVRAAGDRGPNRKALSCGNLAHGFAACAPLDKSRLKQGETPNLGIITAYNDMLSAHQPYEKYPEFIRKVARDLGATAQVAGGVPAMCDGVTQGEAGMELSLFSRDVIAMAAAIGLSHNMFDAAVFLGICDKIVPGLMISALAFGHLPCVFIPAGPMPSGLSNVEKVRVRQLYAEGKVGRDELLEAESQSYHAPGTCTFYGTANSNQMLMEMMGLHLPGASFVNPGTPLRDALTRHSVERALSITALGNNYLPVGEMIDEKAIVNGMIGLLATGGSTNHALHLVAIAKAAGIIINWDDLSKLSDEIPLLARVYPNGMADVNHFHAAGGMGYLIGELGKNGKMHKDTKTVFGTDIGDYALEPYLEGDELKWRDVPGKPGDPKVLSTVKQPFAKDGGLKLLAGNIGRAVIKSSAVKEAFHIIEAPAKIFHDQLDLIAAFKAGKLEGDFVAVVRFCGPCAMGMPELHKLTPILGILQDRGQRVALVTDGRMSGASGKVAAAIHVTPEAAHGGPIAKIQEGDLIRLDVKNSSLEVLVDEEEFDARQAPDVDLSKFHKGTGRELFNNLRACVAQAELGASVL